MREVAAQAVAATAEGTPVVVRWVEVRWAVDTLAVGR